MHLEKYLKFEFLLGFMHILTFSYFFVQLIYSEQTGGIICFQHSVCHRSGYSGSSSKLDGSSSPTPNACTAANNEREKVSRGSVDGSNKERVVLKGNKYVSVIHIHDAFIIDSF